MKTTTNKRSKQDQDEIVVIVEGLDDLVDYISAPEILLVQRHFGAKLQNRWVATARNKREDTP